MEWPEVADGVRELVPPGLVGADSKPRDRPRERESLRAPLLGGDCGQLRRRIERLDRSRDRLIVSRLGVLRLILAMTAGQAIGGLGLDIVAPARGEMVTAGTVIGVVLACAAVLVSGRGSRAPT